MKIETFPLILEWSKMITPRVMHLAFRREDEQAFDFIPGQFITFHINTGEKILRRSYSIATIPGESKLIEVAAGYVEDGVATDLLYNMKAGDKIPTAGPFGRLVLKEEHPKRYILVATGTGVTPYRAMLPSLLEQLENESDLNVYVLLGVRSREELLYGDEFQTMAERQDRFHFKAYYSRDLPENPHPFEYQGYVQHSFAELQLNPESDIVYLCGNPHMIDDAYAILKEDGFSVSNVRREKYISSGH